MTLRRWTGWLLIAALVVGFWSCLVLAIVLTYRRISS